MKSSDNGQDSEQGYNVYTLIYGGGDCGCGQWISVYNTGEKTIVDSIPLDEEKYGWAFRIAVTNDERYLLVSADKGNQGYTIAIDRHRRGEIHELPYAGNNISVSPNGKHIAIGEQHQLTILNARSLEVVKQVPGQAYNPVFDHTSRVVWALDYAGSGSSIVRYDVIADTLYPPIFVYDTIVGGAPWFIQPTHDPNKVFLSCNNDPMFEVVSYYVNEGSVGFRASIYGFPAIALTPDGQRFIFTDAHHFIDAGPTTNNVYIVDAVNDTLVTVVDKKQQGPNQETIYLLAYSITLTPDGKEAAFGTCMSCGGSPQGVLSLDNYEYDQFFWSDSGYWGRSIDVAIPGGGGQTGP